MTDGRRETETLLYNSLHLNVYVVFLLNFRVRKSGLGSVLGKIGNKPKISTLVSTFVENKHLDKKKSLVLSVKTMLCIYNNSFSNIGFPESVNYVNFFTVFKF